ncbi:MAG: hypothetical protein ACOC3I_01670, partial [Verrucomicrobiota bacterium]
MNAREARNRPGVDLFAALWQRLTWRHWREDRGSTLLLLALLSLGVAAFLAIRMANREAVAGFLGATPAEIALTRNTVEGI